MRYAKFDSSGKLISTTNLANIEEGYIEVPASITNSAIKLDQGIVKAISEEELAAEFARLLLIKQAGAVRLKRNTLLAEADKLTQLDLWDNYDSETKKKITLYKQALRDLTKQEGFPSDVVYPTLEKG